VKWPSKAVRALLAAALVGCGGEGGGESGVGPSSGAGPAGSSGGGPRLLFVTNTYSDWWAAVEKGMNDGAAEFGARAEMRKNLKGETQRQIELLEEALSLRDVQGVAVSVVDAKAVGVADVLKRISDAGKVVITIDSDLAAESAGLRRAYIGTNNRNAGEVAGKAAAALRPEGGKVAVFVGIPSAANAIERREGFFAGAGPNFIQQEVFADKVDKKVALDNVQVATSKYPDLGVLLGLWSYNAPAIAEFVQGAPEVRKKVTVVTFDLDENAIPQVAAGYIDATVCQNPYEMGYRGVRLLKAYIEKDQATIDEMLPDGATTIDTGVRVVVPNTDSPVRGENVMDVESMRSWLASKGLKST
jgi:ribose transport system substrate-binding protein